VNVDVPLVDEVYEDMLRGFLRFLLFISFSCSVDARDISMVVLTFWELLNTIRSCDAPGAAEGLDAPSVRSIIVDGPGGSIVQCYIHVARPLFVKSY